MKPKDMGSLIQGPVERTVQIHRNYHLGHLGPHGVWLGHISHDFSKARHPSVEGVGAWLHIEVKSLPRGAYSDQ